MQERYDKKKMKEQEKEMKGKAKEEVERRRKRVEENRQRREENRKKAEVLQKVSVPLYSDLVWEAWPVYMMCQKEPVGYVLMHNVMIIV